MYSAQYVRSVDCTTLFKVITQFAINLLRLRLKVSSLTITLEPRGVFSAGGRVCATPLREGGVHPHLSVRDAILLTNSLLHILFMNFLGSIDPRGSASREQDVATTATHASAGKSAAQRWQAEEHGAGVAARGALSTEHYL